LIGKIFPTMDEDLDKEKLKEVKEILSMVSTNKEYLPKLRTLEKENNYSLYVTQLIIDQLIDEETLKLILLRIGKINFYDKEEMYIRKIIQEFSKTTNDRLQRFLENFLKHDTLKSYLFLIIIDEISKLNSGNSIISIIFGMVRFMEPDEIILKFYFSSLEFISKDLDSSYENLFFLAMCAFRHELLDDLYPKIESIVLKAKISENMLSFVEGMLNYISQKNISRIFEKIGDALKGPENQNILVLLVQTFKEYKKYLEEFSV
jgi:hypothetical protein